MPKKRASKPPKVSAPAQLVELWPIDKPKPYDANPRSNEAAVANVAESIRKFGFRNPIRVDKAGVIIAGHTRLKAAQSIGLSHVPVVVDSDLTAVQARALRIYDNSAGQAAEWDDALLGAELAALVAEDFDLAGIGFSQEELDALLGKTPAGEDQDADPQVGQAEELRKKWGVELGQLWALGDHRILCGDATKAEDVAKALDGAVPLLMVTDPPYGVEYDPEWRADAGVNKNKAKMGKVQNDDRADWSAAWMLFPGDVAYVYHADVMSATVQASLETSGFLIRAQIIWAKDRMALSREDYHWQHEPCWYAVRDGKPGLRNDDRTQTTLWTIPSRDDSGHGHGTQKPVECMAKAIRNHESEFVYEPFSGSGTTIIACENLGRKCRAIEISPGYVAVALQRYLDATGKQPVKV